MIYCRLDMEIYQKLHGETTEDMFKKFFRITKWNWINPDGTLTKIKDPSKTIMWCSNLNENGNEHG